MLIVLSQDMIRMNWSGRTTRKLPLIVVLVVAAAGITTLLSSRAASPAISTEPERGALSTTAVAINDDLASNKQAIKFGAPPTVAAPTTPDGFTKMFADKHDRVWSGGDQNTSYRAPNGIIYWLAGDTILSDGVSADGSYPQTGTVMISNRILMQQGGEFVNAMANGGLGVPDPPSHTEENQDRFWPQGIFSANNKMYVICQRVKSDGNGGFALISGEMASYRIAPSGKLTFEKMVRTPSTGVLDGLGPAHIQWASDALIKDGFVYLYGYTKAAQNPYVPIYSYVARVPTAEVENAAAWRYFKKSTNQWVTSTSQLSTDLVGQPDALLPTQAGSVREIGGKFVVVHKPWNGFGSAVYAEISNTPYGPFTQKYLFDSPAGIWQGSNYTTYIPQLHPEQSLSGSHAGHILVSINWNGVDLFTDTLKNADLYKPRFYAFPLP